MSLRYTALCCWVNGLFNDQVNLAPLAGDASFRRYFRAQVADQRYIAVDASPNHENNPAFISVATTFKDLGIRVPKIYHTQIDDGFLLLEDFGDDLLLNELKRDNNFQRYTQAIDQLLLIQQCHQVENYTIPMFDKNFMLKEMGLFKEWYLKQQLALPLSTAEESLIDKSFELLVDEILQQPKVCVHRDFHSRNLMCLADGGMGVLDFQDAVWGPVSYDLVSLLKDCYIRCPRETIKEMTQYYHQQAQHYLSLPDYEIFLHWLDTMGIQRHLKAIGIFARLNLHYGKPNYLAEIPLTLSHLFEALQGQEQLQDFAQYLQTIPDVVER